MISAQSIAVTVVSKPDCHLCDEAEARVDEVVGEWTVRHPDAEVLVEVVDMLADPDLIARYSEDVPVVLINGRVHAFWRVDQDRLSSALDAAISD